MTGERSDHDLVAVRGGGCAKSLPGDFDMRDPPIQGGLATRPDVVSVKNARNAVASRGTPVSPEEPFMGELQTGLSGLSRLADLDWRPLRGRL